LSSICVPELQTILPLENESFLMVGFIANSLPTYKEESILVKPLFSLLLFLAIIINGCVYAPTGLAPSIEPLRDKNYKTVKSVQGKQTTISLLGAVPLAKPDYNVAIREALKGEPEGSSLINVRTYYRTTYLFLVTVHTLIVEGEVIKK